jgi:hypothetical protein
MVPLGKGVWGGVEVKLELPNKEHAVRHVIIAEEKRQRTTRRTGMRIEAPFLMPNFGEIRTRAIVPICNYLAQYIFY